MRKFLLVTLPVATLFALTIILVLAVPAQAVMLKLSLDELAQKADSVVIGSVIESTSRWNNNHTCIYTEVVFNVEDVLKGTAKQGKVSLILPGGQVGDIGLTVSDVPRFETGEKAVLFLEQLSQDQFKDMRISYIQGDVSAFKVCGRFQGKLNISNNQVCNVSVSEFKTQLRDTLETGKKMSITADGTAKGTGRLISNYRYTGYKWPGSNPTVIYKFNATYPQRCAIDAAARTWSSACNDFRFYNSGPTSTTQYTQNGVNEIFWQVIDDMFTPAQTRLWNSGNTITECDLAFDPSYSWACNSDNTCPSDCFDLQYICLHEMGHWLALYDLYDPGDSATVMYGEASIGSTTKRVLHSDDIAGIRYIYGGPGVTPLSSPLDGAYVPGTQVTFSWTAPPSVSVIDNYWLRVNTNYFFTGADIYNGAVGYVGSKTVSGFPNTGTTYYWYAQAHDTSDHGWSDQWSYRSFINGPPPPPGAPPLSSPANGANVAGSAVTFSWTAPTGTGIDGYYLRVNTHYDFTGTDIYNGGVGYVGSKTVSGFPNAGGTYFWYVLAHNAGGWGPASSTHIFYNGTAPSLPGVPPVSSPANGANVAGSAVTFSWTAPTGTGIDNYYLRVNTHYNFTGTDIYNGGVGYVGSKTVSGFPNTGGSYYWYVLAHNGAGWGPASSTHIFYNGTTPSVPGAPPLSSPAPGANVPGSAVTFSWTAPSGTGIDNYWLRVNTNSSFTGTDIVSAPVGYVGSARISGFSNTGATYYWYVLAHNAAGWGTVSSVRSFINGTTLSLPGAPPLSSPLDGAHVPGTQVTFSWTAPSGTGIDGYYLRVNTNSSFTGTDIYSGGVGYVGSKTVSGFPNTGGTYYWYVLAHNAAGWGTVSSVRSFINGP